MGKCFKCGIDDPAIQEDYQRCGACNSEHQKLVAELDAKPKQVIQKVPEKWVYYKEVKDGVIVTVRMTEQEALMLGKRIQ